MLLMFYETRISVQNFMMQPFRSLESMQIHATLFFADRQWAGSEFSKDAYTLLLCNYNVTLLEIYFKCEINIWLRYFTRNITKCL